MEHQHPKNNNIIITIVLIAVVILAVYLLTLAGSEPSDRLDEQFPGAQVEMESNTDRPLPPTDDEFNSSSSTNRQLPPMDGEFDMNSTTSRPLPPTDAAGAPERPTGVPMNEGAI